MTAILWVWSALTGWLLLRVARVRDRKPAILRASVAAVWFAPAVLFAAQMTVATVIPAVVLAAVTARLLFIEWRRSGVPPVRPQSPVPAMLTALLAQSALAAFLANHPILGASLGIMAVAIVTVYSLETGAAEPGRAPQLAQSSAGAILTVLLALGLTAGGSWGVVAGEHAGYAVAPAPPPARPTMPQMGGDFSGVILLSETQTTARLVDPRPYLGPGRLAPIDHKPLSILFDGRYDIFRWPFRQAPPSSYTRKGSPVDLGFRSADARPLQMEAHQKLDIPLDVHCCRSIKLDVRNADNTPGRIWLELVLLDHGAAVSVGRMPVKSMPKVGEKVSETLEFPLGMSIPLEEADELKVIFSRTMGRMERSVKVAVERFILEPR
jgi:hypothetical protein